jgi:hypothetical protein
MLAAARIFALWACRRAIPPAGETGRPKGFLLAARLYNRRRPSRHRVTYLRWLLGVHQAPRELGGGVLAPIGCLARRCGSVRAPRTGCPSFLSHWLRCNLGYLGEGISHGIDER